MDDHQSTKRDISASADIKTLVDAFYAKVRADELIGPIFNDIAKVNWERHLPVMYNFWEFLLLERIDLYHGNPIQKHMELHRRYPLKAEHFDRWVALFQTTVDEFFQGPVAEDAKFRAFAIATTWKPKFDGSFAF